MMIRSCALSMVYVKIYFMDDSDVDPFEGIPEDAISLEDFPGLKIDPNYSDQIIL